MRNRTLTPRMLLAAVGLAALTSLHGCAPLVVGGAAATTALVAADRRTAGEQVEDKAIELKITNEMQRLFTDRQGVRINAHSYAGQVLLVGDVPSEQDKQRAGEAAQAVDKVVRVINELRVGAITPISVRTNDAWLTSKVSGTLINTKDVPSRTINVTTERGIVYLQGRVTEDEAARAAIAAAGVAGVNKVVKLFEIVPAGSLQQRTQPQAAPEAGTPSQPHDTGAAPESGGVQALPVQ